MRFGKKKSNVALGLGWFSIGLGLTEILAGSKLARALGLEHRTGLIRLFGAREIISGVLVLTGRQTAPWLWLRVAGDMLDLGVLATALSSSNPKRDAAKLATASVLGVTALDVASGAAHAARA